MTARWGRRGRWCHWEAACARHMPSPPPAPIAGGHAPPPPRPLCPCPCPPPLAGGYGRRVVRFNCAARPLQRARRSGAHPHDCGRRGALPQHGRDPQVCSVVCTAAALARAAWHAHARHGAAWVRGRRARPPCVAGSSGCPGAGPATTARWWHGGRATGRVGARPTLAGPCWPCGAAPAPEGLSLIGHAQGPQARELPAGGQE